MKILICGKDIFLIDQIFKKLIHDHEIYIAGTFEFENYNNFNKIDVDDYINWNDLCSKVDIVINTFNYLNYNNSLKYFEVSNNILNSCIKNNVKLLNLTFIVNKNTTNKYIENHLKFNSLLRKYKNSINVYTGVILLKDSKFYKLLKELSLPHIMFMLQKNESSFYIHVIQICSYIQFAINNFDNNPRELVALPVKEKLYDILDIIGKKRHYYIHLNKNIINFLFYLFPKIRLGIFNKDLYNLYININIEQYERVIDKASYYIAKDKVSASYSVLKFFAISGISFFWIYTGITSIYNFDISLNLAKNFKFEDSFGYLLVGLISFINILFGILILFRKLRKLVLIFQILSIILFSISITLFDVQFLTHPYGIISKNILVIILLLYVYRKSN